LPPYSSSFSATLESPPSALSAAAAAAALRAAHEKLVTKTTKTLVPLATPQGYDPVARTLTIAKWQVAGVPYDPADDSPAIAQVGFWILGGGVLNGVILRTV
jgi:cobalamin biosynthesis protein CbiD